MWRAFLIYLTFLIYEYKLLLTGNTSYLIDSKILFDLMKHLIRGMAGEDHSLKYRNMQSIFIANFSINFHSEAIHEKEAI